MRRRNALGAGSIGLGILATGGWSIAACSSGFLDRLFDGPIAAEAGGADAPAERCALRHVPEPVASADSANVAPLVFAFETLRIDDREGDGGVEAGSGEAGVWGFDLDDACTCSPEESSCLPPDGGAVRCDYSGGRDNAVGPLVGTAIDLLGSIYGKERFISRKIDEGDFTVLLTISDWNGQPDDPKVTVALLMSGVLRNADGGRVPPSRDGGDRWTIDRASLTAGDTLVGQDCTKGAGCIPKYSDTNAYVRDNQLVARIPAPLKLVTTGGPLDVELNGMTLVARIVPDGSSKRLEGEIVGRWPTEKLLSSLSRLIVVDAGLCKGPFYPSFKDTVCTSADIAADPAMDRNRSVCNALSASLSFTAGPASFAIVSVPPTQNTGCEDFRDTCF